VFSGVLASTCLTVLFVPAVFVVMQQVEEWRTGKRRDGAVVGKGSRCATNKARRNHALRKRAIA
jgi:hypothetical protein